MVTSIAIPSDLYERLWRVARRLKRDPEECAASAIRAFVEDCEENAAMAERLGGGDGIFRTDGENHD